MAKLLQICVVLFLLRVRCVKTNGVEAECPSKTISIQNCEYDAISSPDEFCKTKWLNYKESGTQYVKTKDLGSFDYKIRIEDDNILSKFNEVINTILKGLFKSKIQENKWHKFSWITKSQGTEFYLDDHILSSNNSLTKHINFDSVSFTFKGEAFFAKEDCVLSLPISSLSTNSDLSTRSSVFSVSDVTTASSTFVNPSVLPECPIKNISNQNCEYVKIISPNQFCFSKLLTYKPNDEVYAKIENYTASDYRIGDTEPLYEEYKSAIVAFVRAYLKENKWHSFNWTTKSGETSYYINGKVLAKNVLLDENFNKTFKFSVKGEVSLSRNKCVYYKSASKSDTASGSTRMSKCLEQIPLINPVLKSVVFTLFLSFYIH